MADTRRINLKADDAPHTLADLRVLDVGSGVGGSYCALLMAGLGAEVVRIELPVRPVYPPMGSTVWTALNRGKKCVTLDITDARGYDVLMGLVDQSDILVHGFLPRSAIELGLQYNRLC
jgi:crotonobetainyl-CoA:carnitine CoA-transferase CaiB-like acyl-CoA transferase